MRDTMQMTREEAFKRLSGAAEEFLVSVSQNHMESCQILGHLESNFIAHLNLPHIIYPQILHSSDQMA